MRRYEFFTGEWQYIDWSKVDHLVFVNSFIKSAVDDWLKENKYKTPTSLIYNVVDAEEWSFRKEPVFESENNIGMVCSIHPKKNIQLALYILDALPEEYSLHVAGPMQDYCLAEYLNHTATQMKRRLFLYGKLPRKQLDSWWATMDYCLSTSMSEGNPNNVLEAMAKGIKPVVHNWPGSRDQFPEHLVFDTIPGAVSIITAPEYCPQTYRDWVIDRYSTKNFDSLYDIIEGL
jgi:glycosyltransferase involved in cell wall biosynthesis